MMMKKKILLLTLVGCLVCLTACTQDYKRETFDYAEKDGQVLRLDVYTDTLDADTLRPVLIFSYGGAWEGGKREDGRPLLEHFARKGYVAIGIDYRLGIRKLKEQGVKIDSTNFAASYGGAIRMGIEDLYDATRFVINHAQEWQVDTSRIVISGSSAGAINSVTAEYLLCNRDTLATSRLPEDFRYAAVIPCAGGIWLQDADTLVWQRKPCPFLAFHGTNDELVPYGKVLLGDTFGTFGPDYYMPQLKAMGVSTQMHRYDKQGHVIAGVYWQEEARNEMTDFLHRVLDKKQQLHVDTTEERPDKAPATKTIEDSFREMTEGQ